MEILLDLLKAGGALIILVAAGLALWKAATRKATLETAREVNEQEQAEVKQLVEHAEKIRSDTDDPDSWH